MERGSAGLSTMLMMKDLTVSAISTIAGSGHVFKKCFRCPLGKTFCLKLYSLQLTSFHWPVLRALVKRQVKRTQAQGKVFLLPKWDMAALKSDLVSKRIL